MSPSALPKKLVTVIPLSRKWPLPCGSQGISHPRGHPSQQKYWCKGWKVEPGRYENTGSGTGFFTCQEVSVFLYAFFTENRLFSGVPLSPGTVLGGCAASEALGWLGSHPSMAALVLQATCRLGPQQDKQSLASALVPRPWRREAQGEEATCVTSGFHNGSVDRQHASPLLCQELCLLTEKTITGCSGWAVYGFLGTPYDRRR